jgi:hypothetical protein
MSLPVLRSVKRLPESCLMEVCAFEKRLEGTQKPQGLALSTVTGPPVCGLAISHCRDAEFVAVQRWVPQAKLPLGSPWLVAAFNAFWKEDILPPLRICSL